MSALRIVLMLILGLAIYFKLFEKRLIFYPERTLAGRLEADILEIAERTKLAEKGAAKPR